ncbi:hypothetical protein TNIN_334121 [Trichonephila inaurata madagascariensis]|uniref:Uncharacterized protein n=1 Tax=Trichonephila inaurata madagascariensis TaxID=2747483 RepID=A0A8X7CC59_9ARAC|nr:hypothetical protein TNIN_334121 [Trichonephila inaurata madagascariensis]
MKHLASVKKSTPVHVLMDKKEFTEFLYVPSINEYHHALLNQFKSFSDDAGNRKYDAPLGAERQYIVKLEDLEHYVKTLSESKGFKEQYDVS